MDKHSVLEKGRKPVGARKIDPITADLDASQVLEQLESRAALHERDLVSLLDVNEKTIRNWKQKEAETASGKLVRLYRLKEVVDKALESSLSQPMIRQLLVAPLDSKDSKQKSILDVIQTEPETQFFSQMVSMLLQNFTARQQAQGHIVLSSEDFESLLADLKQDVEPSDNLKNTRNRFTQLRSKITK